ncbi:mannosyltransferase protein [Yamadazyma tenuis]|uniref:Uncharacterized protein n=1 Tax=Candida tenuis (strain ATCC 10573 / BCRC 21748 / CBS 615 / JCM 9827 / NBRC 10315 / NRRL Y-1498 / VKM Y-70) TaxID=590646 RepID=G3B1N7_CANTC|nr:uncharacterized protein CANTEDRAFT_104028 [Yamadazyma tenuis ATCC 10573]EGV64492.1 hypothetical protein CANTEDRAFT_104028 [Yamadazyma tenuis ATCC 10573]WEJ97254.1 mannosyltransferase protein [Yamadazyma tenuis]
MLNKLLYSKRGHGTVVLLFFCVLASILLVDTLIHDRYLVRKNSESTATGLIPARKNIVYPNTFNLANDRQDLLNHYNIYFNESNAQANSDAFNIFRYDGSTSWLHPQLIGGQYHPHNLQVYEYQEINDCAKRRNDISVEISNYIQLDPELVEMVKVMQRQLKTEKAFEELKPFFKDDLRTQLKTGSLTSHWYKFAGSSVWLEKLGVHMVISRVIYSITGSKRKPIMSLAYVQIYDQYWTELKDVELVLPIQNELSETEYSAVKFPKFLPIPFYNDPKYQKKVYYGPEDTRLFLVKNDQGEEEPMIIFNSYHRKVIKNDGVSEKEMTVSFGFYRSMFLSWPFRMQRGKINVDGVSNKKSDSILYNKVVELRREDVPRLKIQKNWTPMISFEDRDEYGHDRYMYFVYRWSKLEILKCNLDNFIEGTSTCVYDYQRKLDSSGDEVGPLRGGTEMLNIRDILHEVPDALQGREMWVGFPRAHIKDCGCGKDMYRPNLAVITKESDKSYKLTQLSSYTSLDIEVSGWTNPKILCASRDPNALISNGISGWTYHNDVDYLTLSLSVADETNHLIHIKNLLNTLLYSTSMMKREARDGFDDSIIDCAISESSKFCKSYGEEMKKLDKTPPPEPDY